VLQFDKEWFEEVINCTFYEENLLEAVTNQRVSFNFEHFKRLEVLVIKKKAIKSDWATITNGLVLMPSPNFRKLTIETESLD